MQLTITATDQITTIGGTQARVWHGTTPGGIPCILFVHRIAVANSEDASEFERELKEQLPPGVAVPLRMALP